MISSAWTIAILSIISVTPVPSLSQAPLRLVDSETSIESVRFRGNVSLSDRRLKEVIATTGPRSADRWVFWRSPEYPFDPVELQKDITRLRRLYIRNGFGSTEIDYIAQLDSSRNQIRILFTIDEGPPLLAQSVDFFAPDGRDAIYQFSSSQERAIWTSLRKELTYLRTGDRLTNFRISRTQDRIRESLSNAGYAFSEVYTETSIDSLSPFADVVFLVDSGPKAHIDSVIVSGLTTVDPGIVRRQLRIQPGSPFEHRLLSRSQRDLFALDLFRLALVDLAPDQPRDSTVTIAVRMEEAAPRYIRAQTGYARDEGLQVEGAWTHRNFLGGARKLSFQGSWLTGWGAITVDDITSGNRQRASLSVHQPFLGSRELSLIVSPYFERRQDPTTEGWEAGLTSNVVYELDIYRPLSVRHTFARAVPILGTADKIGSDFYSKSLIEATALLGRLDSYVRPNRGLLLQPFFEYSGGLLQSDVEYLKFGGDLSAYIPVGRSDFAFRVFAGALHTWGASADPDDPVAAERIDPVRFYAGGARDVRGWSNRGLGPKTPVLKETDDATPANYVYEPDGGTAKLAGSVDLGIPILGEDRLSAGIFLDFAQVVTENETLSLNPSAFRFGSGFGVRVNTPAGLLRIDLAAKLNPSDEDLRAATDYAQLGVDAPVHQSRRFRVHISIGRDL